MDLASIFKEIAYRFDLYESYSILLYRLFFKKSLMMFSYHNIFQSFEYVMYVGESETNSVSI